MQRIILLAVIISTTVVLQGCSYHAHFVIINESARVLTVKYVLQPTEAIPYPTVKGRLANIEKFKANDRDFEAFPEDRISVGSDRRSATVKLNPGEVLLLVTHDIRDIEEEPVYKSGIGKLSIDAGSGSQSFEGDQVFQQFKPGRWAWFPGAYLLYTFTYK